MTATLGCGLSEAGRLARTITYVNRPPKARFHLSNTFGSILISISSKPFTERALCKESSDVVRTPSKPRPTTLPQTCEKRNRPPGFSALNASDKKESK